MVEKNRGSVKRKKNYDDRKCKLPRSQKKIILAGKNRLQIKKNENKQKKKKKGNNNDNKKKSYTI